MSRALRPRRWLPTRLCLFALAGAPQPQAPFEEVPPEQLLREHCGSCHGERRKRDVDLLAALGAEEPADGALLRKAARRVQDGVMPPRRERGPGEDERAAIAAWLRREAEEHELAARPPPGAAPLRRLTHEEYRRIVRDLLGVELSIAAFPGAGSGGEGFRNFAGSQRIAPVLFESYRARRPSAPSRRSAPACGPGDGGDPPSARRMLEAFAARVLRSPGDEVAAPFLAYPAGRSRGAGRGGRRRGVDRLAVEPVIPVPGRTAGRSGGSGDGPGARGPALLFPLVVPAGQGTVRSYAGCEARRSRSASR